METPFGVWLPQITILECQRLDQAMQAVEVVRAHHCVVLQLGRADPWKRSASWISWPV